MNTDRLELVTWKLSPEHEDLLRVAMMFGTEDLEILHVGRERDRHVPMHIKNEDDVPVTVRGDVEMFIYKDADGNGLADALRRMNFNPYLKRYNSVVLAKGISWERGDDINLPKLMDPMLKDVNFDSHSGNVIKTVKEFIETEDIKRHPALINFEHPHSSITISPEMLAGELSRKSNMVFFKNSVNGAIVYHYDKLQITYSPNTLNPIHVQSGLNFTNLKPFLEIDVFGQFSVTTIISPLY